MEQHITLSMVELLAAIVGLVTGILYTYLRLPIPAPPVLGGIMAILGTWIGLTIVQLIRAKSLSSSSSEVSSREEYLR